MNRTPLPSHAVTRKPLSSIIAALSLAAFIAVGGAFGGIALAVFFVLWSAALYTGGRRFRLRQLRELEQERARAVKAHIANTADRMLFAGRQALAYEAVSEEQALGFGRVVQEVPDSLREKERVSARHAADLVAESVIRMRVNGYPVTVFDLETINHSDVWELRRHGPVGRVVEATKDYLTVCVVELPMRLPYVASAHVFGAKNFGGSDRAADPEFADFLLSRPAVRESALARDPMWSVEQDRLIACVLTNHGLDTQEVVSLADRVSALAGAFPWPELERFRLPELPADGRPPVLQYHLWASQWWAERSTLGPWGLRWDMAPLGRSGLSAFTAAGEWLNERGAREARLPAP